MKELYEQLGISSQVYDFGAEIEESLKERFEQFCYKYRIWSDDSYVYIISGNCDEKLLLHMAESVNKKH